MEGYIGEIRMFAGTFAPRNWALCAGQLISMNDFPALFSIIGTIYGGNGTSTMGLPDLRGRIPLQQGNGPGLSSVDLGQRGGGEEVQLTTRNLPAHNHSGHVNAAAAVPNSANPKAATFAASKIYETGTSGTIAMDPTSITINNTGNSYPFSIRNPYLGVNFIICLEGIFPSRS